jgi:hypothetical protein
MREHQIIINLKPEHYQELERLSRAAGARSVSVFVKERMLASLGIGGAASAANAPGSLNLAAVTSDIRRLHRDLQVFVAESLSGKDFGYAVDANEQQALTPGAELARAVADVDSTFSSTHALQAPTERTQVPDEPVVSVDQLAPPGNSPPNFSPAIEPPSMVPSQGNADGTVSALPSNQAIPRQQGQFPLRGRGPGTTFGSIIPGLASFRSPEPVTPNPEPSNRTISAPSETLVSGTGGAPPANIQASLTSASLQASLQPTEVPDDLEELAERAFAISPRLGAMEEVDDDTPMFSDPLDELLGEIEDEELQLAQAAEAAEATQAAQAAEASQVTAANSGSTVPNALTGGTAVTEDATLDYETVDTVGLVAEDYASDSDETSESGVNSETQVAQGESPIQATHSDDISTSAISEDDSRLNELSSDGFGQSGLDWDDAQDDTNEAARNERENVGNETLQSNPEAGSQDEDNTNQSGTNTGLPQNPPPISGGPPPRRRRT